jgi:beta-lactamase class A
MRVALALALALGCQHPVDAPATTTAALPAPGTKPAEPALPAGVPDTPAGRELAWLLRVIAHDAPATKPDLDAHFAASFLAAVPTDQLLAGFQQLRDMKLVDAKSDSTGMKLVAHLVISGQKLRAQLALDQDHKIAGLLFEPDLGEKPTSWDSAEEQLRKAAPHVQMLAAELDGGTCKPLHALDPKTELAIGSAFKLYVLLAVADRIAADTLAWDTPVEIRDDWKSLPSGTTQNEPAGTKRTVRELADKMISISDNTAADHLLYTAGRAVVEAELGGTKHAQPALDKPFFATRELFLLKLGMAADEIDRYLTLPEAKRREYLDRTLAGHHPSLDGAKDWKTARRVDHLEWYASSEDLCGAMAALERRSHDAKLAPILDVLSINPGVPVDKRAWPYVGYKGGSEPGVIDLTWLLRRADGRWFVLTLTANSDEGGAVPEETVIGIGSGMLDLLAKDK